MLSDILTIVESACSFQVGSLSMDPNCAVEEILDSLQSCLPFSGTDNNPQSLVSRDISSSEVLVGAFSSINIGESPGQGDVEGKDKVKFGDTSVINHLDTTCSSRSACMPKLNKKTQRRKAARKCGRTVVKKPLFDSVLLRVARKRRSYFCKPARSSVWGSLGYIAKIFECSSAIDVDRNENAKSRKSRSAQGSRKRNKILSQSLRGKSGASSGRIRLKVTLGKKMVQSFQTNMVSVTDNDLRNYWGTTIEVPKSTNDSENKLKEEAYGIDGYKFLSRDQEKDKVVLLSNAPHLDMCIANKDLESLMIGEKSSRVTADNHQFFPSQMDNRYLDSGTSPDSEVINLMPEAQVNGKVQEDLYDVLISSQGCVAPGDCHLEKPRTSSKKGRRKNKSPHAGNQDCAARGDCHLDVPRTSSKKGKKKNKLPHTGNLCVEDRLSIPEIINGSTVLERHGQGEKIDDGFCSSEASISTTRSSSEGFSMGALSSSRVTNFGISSENLHVEGRTEEDKPFRLGVGLESPEPNISMKLCPYIKTKGRKHLKSSKTSGVRKSGSEVSDSPSRQRGNASRQKGNPMKSVCRRKVEGKGACTDVFCKVENHPETDHPSDEPVVKIGNESTTRDVFSLDKMPRGLGEQYLPPRNAWVRCDDCLKWRRIAATLADSIEETNSRWICKDNMDKGFADCSIPQEKSNAEINVELEISDASCEEDASDARFNSKKLEQKTSTVHQQSSWMLIKSNLFLHRSRKSQTIDEIMVCHCKPPLNGRMGCGDGCLNRILNIECVKGTCPCGERCSNQQFQKHIYSKLKWFRCGKKGYGLQSLEDVSEGQFLIEYVGEVLDMQAYEARQKEYASMGHKHFYFMTLNGSEVIDACAKGNLGRFINHSCDPNCRTEKWMVNGEVCIGLFALRDIRKGEEVTFDYNYVRVFGAAAKECVCGSSQCRGYIGGDPQKTEVIVQGDSDEEYPEPVMFYEDGEIDENLKHLISAISSFDDKDMQIADNKLRSKDKVDKSATEVLIKDEDKDDKSATAIHHFKLTTENSLEKSASGARLNLSLEMDNSVEKFPSVLRVENSSPLDDVSNKTSSEAQQEFVKSSEFSELTVISSKSLSDTSGTKKKGKSETIGDKRDSKSRLLVKTTRSSSSVKKGKLTGNSVNIDKSELMVNKTHVQPSKPRKIMEGSLNGRFEAVEEKLNELLDADGGISKRKDATKGYLKLLLLTATSGDSGNGEAIQSNRDLSMILDGLLKTKSRMVLIDIINKNGLQMLHNIMKRYRRVFNKIPILRKLLKVLEYLAVREILTLEHINGGPPCPGVESFRESILKLTEHDDRQVLQIARNFRYRWIRKPVRKSNCIDRSDGRVEFLRGSNCNRYSSSFNHWRDSRSTETINCSKQSIPPTSSVDAATVEGCSASGSSDCPANGTKTRKRKSRWDQPAEIKTEVKSPQHKEPKIQPSFLQNSHNLNGAVDQGQNIDEEDVPPGFSPPTAPMVPSNASSTLTDINHANGIPSKFPCEVVMGHPNGRFNNRLTLSYGLPLPLVQQFGSPQAESMENWVIAPGMPFHPFPPLPPHPRHRKEPPPGEQCTRQPSICYLDQNPPSTSGATSLPEVEIQGGNNQHSFQQVTGTCSLGKRYFRQQKWNNLQVGPPWPRKRSGWGFMGNNSGNEIKGPNSSEYVNTIGVSACDSFYHYPH